MIDSKRYVSIAVQELSKPTLEVTKQYLQAMEVELENEVPRVARVDFHHTSESIAVYFYIKEERFFIVVNLSKGNNSEVEWVWIESGHRVYLTATSESLGYEELANYLPYDSLTGWSKGDLHMNGRRAYKFTRVSYEPNVNEAYGLEEKLLELLMDLEKSSGAIHKLVENSKAYISICRHQYISANAGIHLDLNILHRLSSLNLELDVDTYITGSEIE
ncbi:DUF4279 domain-containing protein [Glaciecola sp. XM2]|jgi:hypothetical protein|uniref:DUF4279 domain-containing protein n=1 Tax=Glaciecola sp. XM2 TaxID=1914931 RepID=UPI001BDF4C9D|nr:DUF4279 domain-containing protein [Glaciecola sp. XM2]MBT1451031.1 DUF4279 domain-containing protein [Glaciecola sp. XM2]